MRLSQLPLHEKPRERMVQWGIDALSLTELLAILLGSGTSGKSVLALAQEVISHFQPIETLFGASIEELMEIKGIGKAKAIQLKAAFGIAARCLSGLDDRVLITTPEDVFRYVFFEMQDEKQEVLMVVLRDVKGKAFRKEIVFRGSLTSVQVHPRELFFPAVRHKAHSLIVVHNHPSGDPTPSNSDVTLTKLLKGVSEMMGIGLVDHLIIGKGTYHSFWEAGFFQRKSY